MPMNRTQLANIDLNLLVMLYLLLKERNVTRAAARLGISQSAMSHALRRLRSMFEDPLLVSTPRGMVPTERALALVDLIEQTLANIESILSSRSRFNPATARRKSTFLPTQPAFTRPQSASSYPRPMPPGAQTAPASPPRASGNGARCPSSGPCATAAREAVLRQPPAAVLARVLAAAVRSRPLATSGRGLPSSSSPITPCGGRVGARHFTAHARSARGRGHSGSGGGRAAAPHSPPTACPHLSRRVLRGP